MNTALWRLDYLSQTKHTICYIYIYIYIYICTPAASARPRCPHGSTVAPPHASGGAGIRTAPAPVHVDAQHSHHICTRIHTLTFAQCAACCKHSYDMHPPPHMTHTHIHVCTVRCVHRASRHTLTSTYQHARTHARTYTHKHNEHTCACGCADAQSTLNTSSRARAYASTHNQNTRLHHLQLYQRTAPPAHTTTHSRPLF